ncbi:PREDICTED: HERV-H LTR-associating protein 1 [Myotis brandtii]|uniref:HERV-H LTR-associating protein 1 n=1 Tax=Myotis brandtii TaxID=109478 RepID=UPI000703F9D0|nr:PREDICTED: HERV-H LTR-associating protein 1 [Myotis brandtii]
MPGFLVRGARGRLCVGLACALGLWNTVAAIKGEAKKEKVTTFLPTTGSGNEEAEKEKAGAFLGATELPARAVDLSALNLTEVVNGMLSRALKDRKKFFSLLSITSYSSFAFHKLSVAVYNISNLKTVDQARFPTRYCYCLSNRTNDLSDFTALLVDIIGNSTSYLTEIFKSTSILSVSQTNASDCIFICVMTGKAGRNLSDFWELAEKSPVINYTFTSSLAAAPAARGTAVASKLTPTSQQTPPRTSPPRPARSTGVSALGASPWTEVPDPLEGEQAVNTDRLPELLATATATATPGSVSPTLPGSATRRAAGAPWVTDGRQAWASTLPVPRAPTTSKEAPGGPPWEALSSAATSPTKAKDTGTTGSLSEPPAGTHGSPSQTSPTSGTLTPGTQTSSPTKAPAPRYPHTGDLLRPLPPAEEPALVPGPHHVHVSRCPQQLLREGPLTAGPLPGAAHKLTPCLMELCRFFQQCLCASPRRDPRTEAMRYCLEFYSWFLKNATHICQEAKRVPHSRTLKQRCLENICRSV